MPWLSRKKVLRWMRSEAAFRKTAAPKRSPKTSASATVFTGSADQWIGYLGASRRRRYEDAPQIDIVVEPDRKKLSFRGQGGFSETLADHLNAAFHCLRANLAAKPFVQDVFDRSVFGNSSNTGVPIQLRLSRSLPSEASREADLGNSSPGTTIFIVLRSSVVDTVLKDIASAGDDLRPEEHLGLCWPVVRRVLSQLMFPNCPRDRFVEKIALTVKTCLIAVNVLYQGRREGRMVPTQAGDLYERYVARRDGFDKDHLYERHPYFRLINQLGFMFEEVRYRGHESFAHVLVREYLDDRYLRLSLAGIMPEVDEVMAPMPFFWEGVKASTPYPRLNHYGILDPDDLKSWKKVEGPFREMGFTLIRQLGIGQFGRVYEALNHYNPHIPRHVALKVDRIVRGKKKEAIQSAEMTMRIGDALAGAPHVIRVFDAGRLKGKRYTFHVLQLVDGDTLDNLVGIAGSEHSSILRPERSRASEKEVERDYLKAIRESTQEVWRRQRMRRPFVERLDLSQELDLLTSILLWLEEIHQAGYAINDLKNGNLMVSRRGQFKGIDLDSYSPIVTPMDRVMDFFFLAVSVLLFLLNASRKAGEPMVSCEGLLHSRDALRSGIRESWPFGNIGEISRGRVGDEELFDFLVDLVERSRDRTYAFEPDAFSSDINRLIALKRNILAEEIVLD